MGSAASSNVKEIIIDQNDSKWDQYKKGRTNSSSTKTSASSLSKRLLQSAHSSSSERKRNEEIRALLATAEKKLADAESKIRNLQRELCTLELRNSELVGETNWLKEQIGEPDVPLRLRSSKNAKVEVQEAEKRLREELEKCRQELKDQQKTHEDRMVQLTNEFGKKIAILHEELINEKMINKKLNDAIKIYEREEEKRRISEALASAPSPCPSELTATTSYTPPPTLDAKFHEASPNDDQEYTTEHINGTMEVSDGKESKETNEAIVARNGDEEVVINDQSSTRQSSPSQHPYIDRKLDWLTGCTSKIIKKRQATSYIANRRAISSTQPRRSPNSLKNVYTLSESMEPIKVMETPRTPSSVRPATADTMHYDVRSRDNRSQNNAERADLSGQMRGSSAPMLFKSRSRAHRRERFNESTNQMDDDLRSIHSNNEHADVQHSETNSDDIEAILNATTASLSNPYDSGRPITAVSALRPSSNYDH